MSMIPLRLLASLIAAVLSCLALNAQTSVARAIDSQLESYPQSTLRDLYKSFFQDRFGPGHLIADTAAARSYLHRETEQMGASALPYYEPAGAGRNFYRVSLAVIKDGIVTEQEFFDAFMESASAVTFPPIDRWREEWAAILDQIPTDILGYEADKAMIESLLDGGDYAVHHSRQFNEAYHPHYRLISRPIFEKRLLPALKSARPQQ